jgi:hypothetical protein
VFEEEIKKLIKLTTHRRLLIPYEALFIQLHQKKGQLITEQTPGEPNPLFQLYLDTTQIHLTNRSIQTDAPLKASFLQDSAADTHKHRYVSRIHNMYIALPKTNRFQGLYTHRKSQKPNVTYNYRQRVKTHESFVLLILINNIHTLNLKLILIPNYYKTLEAVCRDR